MTSKLLLVVAIALASSACGPVPNDAAIEIVVHGAAAAVIDGGVDDKKTVSK